MSLNIFWRFLDVIHGYGGMFPMHGPLPPYGMIMEYKRLLEGAALPGSLNYQYIAANYFQLHSKCTRTFIYTYILLLLLLLLLRARRVLCIYVYTRIAV